MIKENYNVIGVMSGTSLDGVDIAHINLDLKNGHWQYKIVEAATKPYDSEWVTRLKAAVDYTRQELEILDREYTEFLAGVIKDFIVKHNILELDAVCTHGHTILHQPKKGITLQIGNLPQLAQLVGQTVVCDFRVQDVAMGGQGAPLVPIGDKLLFPEAAYCLNLGGFSNISFDNNSIRTAFDICPVNTVLNHYANELGLEYDDGGRIASDATVNGGLLAELNTLEYYSKPYPKSLGFEFVKAAIFPLIESYALSAQDKIATFTEHVALQIARVVNDREGVGSMLVSGGGTYNSYLLERLKQLMPKVTIIVPDDKTIQYKEALIFALLGVLRLRNEINVLASVTGAAKDHSSGKIFYP